MSCRDRSGWRALLAHRFERAAVEPAEWPQALAHLNECAQCRNRALELDPTLVFQRLPEPAAAGNEIEAMREAVARLRRSSLRRTVEAPPSRRLENGWRWAAAAALVLALGAQSPLLPRAKAGNDSLAALVSAPSAVATGVAPASLRGASGFGDQPVGSLPLVENADLPEARVYELGDRNLAVVMIVDKSLDL